MLGILPMLEDHMTKHAVPFRHAAVLAGVPLRTAQHWEDIASGRRKTWPDGSEPSPEAVRILAAIGEAIERSQATWAARTLENITKAAEAVNDRTGIPEWRAGAWLLEHHPATKRDWSEYREQRIEHAGTVDHSHRMVREMSDQQLIEALPDEWRELIPERSGQG